MTNLELTELKNVSGGALGTSLIIGGIIVFLISVLDGYVRPIRCR